MNIPCPTIRHIIGYSYISLKEIIQDALTNSCTFKSMFLPPPNKKISCLNESMLCKNLNNIFLRVDNTVDFLITRWSDDFKPCNIKSNKSSSVWVVTVLIYPKHEEKNL